MMLRPFSITRLIRNGRTTLKADLADFASPLPFMTCGGVKIGGLVGQPAQKPGHFDILHQCFARAAHSRQLSVGKMRMNGAVAYWVNGHGLPPLLRLGHRVMPLNAPPQLTCGRVPLVQVPGRV